MATPEQDNECKKVINEKDYYKLLNIDRNSSQDEIRRAYKKVINLQNIKFVLIISKLIFFKQIFFNIKIDGNKISSR